jgi:riboflavin biosynthesis pyrimidine reductase
MKYFQKWEKLEYKGFWLKGAQKLMSQLSQGNLIDALYWFRASKINGKKRKNTVTALRVSTKANYIKGLKLENTMQIKSDNLEVYAKR